MNDDETSRLRPEHLTKWLQRSREYLCAPRADAGNVAMIDAQSAAAALIGLIQNLALGMSAGTRRPEMLLRDAATAFPVYLDGILAAPTSRRDGLFN